MRKKLLYFLIVSCVISITSKAEVIVGKYYITTVDKLVVFPSSSMGNTEGAFYFVKVGTVFTVTGIDRNNNLLITFPFKNNDSTEQKNPPKPNLLHNFQTFNFGLGALSNSVENYLPPPDAFIGSWAGGLSFNMPLSTFNSGAQLFYGKGWQFNWGALTLPVRVRFGNGSDRYFSFEEKLNLGLSAGVKLQFQGTVERSINFMGGFGVTSVKTDSVSLQPGYYKSDNTSELALTFNIGVFYQYKVFQIGLFAGKDYLPSTLSRQWKYQGKT